LLSKVVLPEFDHLYAGFQLQLPPVTEALIAFARAAPAIVIAILVIAIGGPLAWRIVRSSGRENVAVERLVMPLPLVGPVLRFNVVARWCDAARLAVG